MNTTVAALVEQTIVACNNFIGDADYSEYAANIQRKADALLANPTAKNAYNVLNDLKAIAKMVGDWTE